MEAHPAQQTVRRARWAPFALTALDPARAHPVTWPIRPQTMLTVLTKQSALISEQRAICSINKVSIEARICGQRRTEGLGGKHRRIEIVSNRIGNLTRQKLRGALRLEKPKRLAYFC